MTNKVEIDLTVNEGQATKAIVKFDKAFDKTSKKTVRSANRMDAAIASFAGNLAANLAGKALGAVSAGFRSIANSFSVVTDAAAIQEDAINKFNTSLVLSGQFSEEASNSFQKYASSLQAVTKFGDEAILTNAALIQSLGNLEEDALKQATAAALDMSAALGIDLTAAATLLGKAATGEIGSLSRYGVIVKRGSDNAETFAKVLDTLQTKFGGSAAAQVNTYSGATQQLSNTWGDLQESFGFIITQNPVVIAAIKGLSKGILEFDGQVKGNTKSLQELSGNALIGAFTGSIEIASKALVGFNNMISSTKSFISFLADSALGALQGIREFTVGILESISSVSSFLGVSTEAADKLKESVQAQINITELGREVERAANAERIEEKEAFAETTLSIAERLNESILNEAVIKETTDKRIIQSESNKQAILLKKKEDAAAKSKKIEEQSFLFQKKFDALTGKQRVQNLQSTLGAIATLQQTSSGAGFAIGKAAAVANHGINAAAAVSKALASAPPPFNFALAGLVGAAMAIQGAKIASAKPPAFANGGVVGGFSGATGGPDDVTITARRGEMFLNGSEQRNLFDIATGAERPQDNNGVIEALLAQPIVLNIDNKEVARATRTALEEGFSLAV